MYLSPIDELTRRLSALPGFGARSARRAALYLIERKEEALKPLIKSLNNAYEKVQECEECGNLDITNPCGICSDTSRDIAQICVVAAVADLWAIERTRGFKGVYHVLGGVLSAVDGVRAENLKISELIERAKKLNAREIILALNATVEAQATAHVVMDALNAAGVSVKISKLAHGVPIGGELDYLDEGTIKAALKARG